MSPNIYTTQHPVLSQRGQSKTIHLSNADGQGLLCRGNAYGGYPMLDREVTCKRCLKLAEIANHCFFCGKRMAETERVTTYISGRIDGAFVHWACTAINH